MVIVRLTPGLANQIYQYCAAYALAGELGQELVLDISACMHTSRGYLLDQFKIPEHRKLVYSWVNGGLKGRYGYCDNAIAYFGETVVLISEGEKDGSIRFADPRGIAYSGLEEAGALRQYRHIYMNGYFSDRVRFFKRYWSELKDFFVLREENEEIRSFRALIAGRISVGVHIRRGDMLYAPWAVRMRDEYYRAAIAWCKARFGSCVFCVFSDDQEYAMRILGEEESIYYIQFHGYNDAAVQEFFCLSLCDHRILSNSSTFSRLADELNYGRKRYVLWQSMDSAQADGDWKAVFRKSARNHVSPRLWDLQIKTKQRNIYLDEVLIAKYNRRYRLRYNTYTIAERNTPDIFFRLADKGRYQEALQCAYCIYAANRNDRKFVAALAKILWRCGRYEESLVEMAGGCANDIDLEQEVMSEDAKRGLLELNSGLRSLMPKHFVIVLLNAAAPQTRSVSLIRLGEVLAHLGHQVTVLYDTTLPDTDYLKEGMRFYNTQGIDMGYIVYSKSNVLSGGGADRRDFTECFRVMNCM